MMIFSCQLCVAFTARLLMQNESLFIDPDNSSNKFFFLVKEPFTKVKTLLLVAAFYLLDS